MPDGRELAVLDHQRGDAQALGEVGRVLRLELGARHAPAHPLCTASRTPDGRELAVLDHERGDAQALGEVGRVLRLELVARHAPAHPLRAAPRTPDGSESVAHRTSPPVGAGAWPYRPCPANAPSVHRLPILAPFPRSLQTAAVVRRFPNRDPREVHLEDRLFDISGHPLVALKYLSYELALAVPGDLQTLDLARRR